MTKTLAKLRNRKYYSLSPKGTIIRNDSENCMRKRLTSLDDSINEVLSRNQPVVVFVHLAEEVREPGLLMVHEFQETLPPIVPWEVVGSLLFSQVGEMIIKVSLSVPGKHPNAAPFVPKEFHSWGFEFRLGANQIRELISILLPWVR